MTMQVFERWRGRLVFRTPAETRQYLDYRVCKAHLGTQVEVRTRRGTRRHICTIVAVHRPGACVDWVHHRGCRPGGLEWASALSRVRFENSPHRESHADLVLRIDASTAPNMLGRYLSRAPSEVSLWTGGVAAGDMRVC